MRLNKLRTGRRLLRQPPHRPERRPQMSVHWFPYDKSTKVVGGGGAMDEIAAQSKETDAGVFTAIQAVGDFARRASLKEEIGRPSLSGLGRPKPGTCRGELRGASPGGPRLWRARSSSRSIPPRYVVELEREKARRAAELEAAEKRFIKINQENLDMYSKIENIMEKLLAEVASTKEILGQMHVPEILEEIRTVVARLAPRTMNCAEAAAKPKATVAAAKTPGPTIKSGTGHTLIVASKFENHTAEQVITKLRGVVDAREMGMAVNRIRKARGQKVVLSCSFVEDTKKIEERLKIRGADLKVAKPEMRLPTVIIRDVLKVNSDEDIVTSLKTQNRHLSEDLDWDKVRARVCYRRRARNDFECHPVLEVSAELHHRMMKAGYVYMGLQRRPVWDQSPLVQCSRCLGYGHGKRFCKEVSERCAHCGGEDTGVTCRARKEGEPPKCINCTRAGCEDTAHGAFSTECGVRAKWDGMVRSKVAYC
ncbi:hypothetical protein EVAR_80232_1 [Eumeta japonica]|uniref:Nucleic-acid-binding protein from transposon X-element n=1 Tax=Eumeta variegata TaxID=151549 RepID=A0A4C1UB14_EUMVA|nr:hypothetical protein EVAR_80232_1 [Eumeta japonica]